MDGISMQAGDFALLEAIAAPILVLDQANIVYANRPFERLLGYSRTELCQREIASLCLVPEAGFDRHYIQIALESAEALPAIEVQLQTVNGSVRSVEVSASRTEIRERVFCVCTCIDQSDIQHVQTSLFEMGAKLNQIVENTPVAMMVMDADHRVTHWNAAAVQLTGVERSELVGSRKGWRPFYADERPILADLILDGKLSELGDSFYHGLWKTSSTVKDAYEVENYFPDLAGQSRWLFFTAAPIKDTHGRVAGAIETLQDVTQRRDAEDALRSQQMELEWLVAKRTQELREKNSLIEALLENAPIGIIATRDSKLQRCNSTFIEIFELQHTEVIGMHVEELFASEQEFSAIDVMVSSVLSSGRAVTCEGRMRTHSGQFRWMQLIGYPADPSKPSAGSWWLMLDRTEIKKAQEELELRFAELRETNARLEEAQNQLLQSEKMASIGQLAAGVAHEINNPIGFVNSNVSTLRRYAQSLCDIVRGYQDLVVSAGLELPAALRRMEADADLAFLFEDLPQLLSETEDGLQRVKRIVQDLKDFSRVDHNEWAVADL
ncbi:MAG: PAS domain S-box protein, partial [Curvibacter sp.]|nr:PAS domain S-box protein [Curvibacter sp.]